MKVLNLVDHFQHGGVQRMAVNVANSLPDFGIESHLCSIMDIGELGALMLDSVHYFPLSANSVYSPSAARRLLKYCKENSIDIIHVHHRALFVASQVSLSDKTIKVIWHDHYGRQEFRKRPWLIYFMFTRYVDGIISVSHPLRNWAINSLRFHSDKVKFIPNFIDFSETHKRAYLPDLPGKPGYRIVCVANFRPHKDHFTLLRGFKHLLNDHPDAHLILVGMVEDDNYFYNVEREISHLALSQQVTNLGKRMDVHDILAASDIGVLSSTSEGLPLTLIEYGYVGLPVVCTDVGDCPWIIKHNERGIIVTPKSPDELATSLSRLLDDQALAKSFGINLNTFVKTHLNKREIVQSIIAFYNDLL